MATKSEQAKAEAAKKGPKPKRARKLARRKPKDEQHVHHEPKAAGKKATYEKEPAPAKGKRPSRKSTRAGANRSKPDTNMNLRSERAKSSPKSRAGASARKATKTRGKPKG
jgi:hypothetical protein